METEKTVTISVRLPESLHTVIARMAQQERRSINQQIIWLTQRGLIGLPANPQPKPGPSQD